MFDFRRIKQALLEGKDGIKDVDKTITFSPSYESDFDPEFSSTELILRPEERIPPITDKELQFLNVCQKLLRKLGFIQNRYQFSEQFMERSKHYFGMLLSENRQPSIDALYTIVKNIKILNDGVNASKDLDYLYKKGQQLLDKKLERYSLK